MEDIIYQVNITMNDNSLTNNQIREIIEEKLTDINIVNIENNVATLLWSVNEGPNEIEEALYYVLDDKKLGNYVYSLSN